MSGLVLSLFPGIGLLDMAFEEEGFCVVRGPDLLWGGDIRRFHPPAGRFDGVIGGPPCQAFSALAALVRHNGHEPRFGNLIPEYQRVVTEARPQWFVMENVPAAPLPTIEGFVSRDVKIDNRWFGEEQQRVRRITFGTRDGLALPLEFAPLEAPLGYVAVKGDPRPTRRERRAFAVTARHAGRMPWQAKAQSVTSSDGAGSVRMNRYTLSEACRLQGLPEDFLAHAPFTAAGKMQVVANGVPLPMGRAIAKAVKRALEANP